MSTTLPSYSLLTSDERRKVQAKLARLMPADAAAALVPLIPDLANRTEEWRPTPHDSGLDAFHRERVLVPLIEPNTLGFGRMIADSVAPRPTTTPDGVLTVTWASPAAHATATAGVVRHYQDTHSAVDAITERAAWGLDSWHSPLTLVPVRHTYADDSKPVLRWMTADGTARVVAARIAYTRLWNTWLTGHPWADPTGVWPADAVTVRQFFAAARAHAQRLADEANSGVDPMGKIATPDLFLHEPRIEDWADLILPRADAPSASTPGGGGLEDLISTWNWRSHNHRGTQADPADRYRAEVYDALTAVDVFSGRDPYEITGGNPATREGRETVTYHEEQVRDFLLDASNLPADQASRAALFAVAVLDEASLTLDSGTDPYALLRDYVIDNLGDETQANRKAATLTVALRAITERLGAPQLSDLYGVWGDLTAGDPNPPLTDPDSPWFWLGAAQGISYAVLLGHLSFTRRAEREFAATLTWLLAHPRGQQQIAAYATACQHGRVQVPLVGDPDQMATASRLRADAAADLAAIGVDVGSALDGESADEAGDQA